MCVQLYVCEISNRIGKIYLMYFVNSIRGVILGDLKSK